MESPPESAGAGITTPRGLSIRVKLFLVVEALLAIVIVAYSWAAYREMRASAIESTAARLDGLATQWSQLLSAGRARQLAPARQVAASAAVIQLVSRPDERTRAAALDTIRRAFPPDSQRALVQVVDEGGGELAGLGAKGPWADPEALAFALRLAVTADSGVTGRLIADGDGVVYPVVARVIADGRVRGHVVEWRRFNATVAARDQMNRLLGGDSARILIANATGDVWSDLRDRVPSPHLDLTAPRAGLTYERDAGAAVAGSQPVAGTPWAVIIEEPQSVVLAQSRRFLGRLLLIGGLAIALGAIGVLWLSISLTRPLDRLTAATEAVAAGDYSRHTGLPPRGDELGRLAMSFDSMVSHLQGAFASRRAAEDSYRLLFNSVPLPLWVVDLETLRILAVNDAAIAHYGYSRDEFLSITVADLRPAEDVARMREAIKRIDGTPDLGSQWRHRKKDGTLIDVETHATSIEFQGRASRIIVVHDITERERSRDEIRRLDERYRRLVQDSPDGITLTGVNGRFLSVNPAFVKMLGYDSEEEVLALDVAATFETPAARAPYIAKLVKDGRVQRHEIRLRRKDGTLITVLVTSRFVTDSDTGEQYFESVSEDVTDLRRVERQFQQAQKMEAVGQLAGGVAHDFNNLLTVILSYSDFLLAELPADAHADREYVEAIRDAGQSASTLTRQLLVFSRQQVIEPKVMRLNDLVTGTGRMLTRLIGEDVELAVKLDPASGAVKVDAGLIEQVIVNLAVNARDAMPKGGRLLIESRNADFGEGAGDHGSPYPAGRYVLLSVSDNGCGMDAATQARLFEPFFTTKEPGKGTGLGLATVYAIVKQSEGQISVYSEPGRGTSFKIYFPRFDEESGTPEQAPSAQERPRGVETILLVEDQSSVRAIARTVLERQGYRVLEAADGEFALDMAAKHDGAIDLLVTDVVMPRMSGRDLADRFGKLRPSARVLFVSGYTDDAIVHLGVLEHEMQFLQKPFTPDALLGKVREVLDTDPARDRS